MKQPHPLPSRRMAVLAVGAAAAGLLSRAGAQTPQAPWPRQPVQLIIPYPPGGSADLLARPLAAQLQQRWGQSVVLDYKPGAGGTIASQHVARARPDGHTLLMVLAAHAINDSLYKKLPYDTRRDFTPVSLVAHLPMIVVGSSKLQARTVAELVAAAKANPGTLTYGSAGNGNTGHLAAEYFSSATGVKLVHVPYKGSADVVNAMLAGNIDLSFDSISTSMPHVRSGRMHALAVTSKERSALAPEVPTVHEQGVDDFEVNGWYAIVGPAGMPAPLTQRLSREVADALQAPQTRARISAQGYVPVGSTPQALEQHIDAEIKRWSAVVATSGARVE